MSKPEFYISIDVETDGPCPGVNSLLQLGAVFYDNTGKILKELCFNIFEIEGAVQDQGTMKWWADQESKCPGIWESMMKDRIPAKLAMERFQSAVLEIHKTGASPVVVAYPASFDFTWLYFYLLKFLNKSCVGFSSLDMKTLGMTILKITFHESTKRNFPKEWFSPSLKHSHNALDDAREQGYLFFKMLDVLHTKKVS